MRFNFQFVEHRKTFYIISSTIAVIGILSLLIFGFNLGVDFKSGTRLDIYIGKAFTSEEIKSILTELKLEASSIRTAGTQNEIAVLQFNGLIDSNMLPQIKDAFRAKYGEKVDLTESKVDPVVGRELAKKAFYAVLLASLGIIIYVAFRFEYRFAITAIIALLHDAFFVITIFSIFHLEVDLPFIAAILTIIGYSINDTIVIFDRIRDNLKITKSKRKDLAQIVNLSLNQTLGRSINTVLTVIVAALALFLLGSEGIRNFSLALLLGLVSGAYSSIFIASQLWYDWKEWDKKRKRYAPQANS